MRRSFLVLGLLAVAACKKDPPPPPPPPAVTAPKVDVPPPAPADAKVDPALDAAFWAWISAHLDELKASKIDSPVLEQLDAELAKVDEGLTFELGTGKQPFELVISADGDTEHFPAVKRLVAAAPALADTKVIAFRPRKALDGLVVEVDPVKLDATTVRFVARPDENRPGLTAVELIVPGVTAENREELHGAAMLLITAAIGEFDTETKLGNVTLVAEPADGGAPQPLTALPAWLDSQKKE